MKCARCRSDAVPKRKHCQDCLNYISQANRARKVRLKKDGLCYRCGKRPPEDGTTRCNSCCQYYIDYKTKREQTHTCTACGGPKDTSYRRNCAACCGESQSRIKTKRQAWILAGLCSRCGRDRDDTAFKQCSTCRKKYTDSYARLKELVLSHYGGKCNCCSIATRAFLTIDHIYGGGTRHRKTIVSTDAGGKIYRWLIKAGFPEGYQVLCFNCNCGRSVNGGSCPHEDDQS